MDGNRSQSANKLICAILALLTIVAVGFSPATASATELSGMSQTAAGRTVSVAADGRGLDLNLLEGDQVNVQGNTATIVDADGTSVATIEVKPPEGYKLAYISRKQYLTVVSTSPFRARGCTNNKFAQWLVGATGAVLVCVPLGFGVGGLTAGIGGALAGGLCAAGADGLKTWVSC